MPSRLRLQTMCRQEPVSASELSADRALSSAEAQGIRLLLESKIKLYDKMINIAKSE